MEAYPSRSANINKFTFTTILKMLFFAAFFTPSAQGLNLLYPLYAFPDASWLDLVGLIKANSKVVFTIVVNVKNGPGASVNQIYSTGIQKFASFPNVRVLGYIDTSNGNCFNWAKASSACTGGKAANRVTDVVSQMSNWIKFYGAKNIDGFYLDRFLPYGGLAAKSTVSTKSVLDDYVAIYQYVKKTFPSYVVVGNPGFLNPAFKATGAKVADIMTTEQAARSYLANPSDKSQASFTYFPAGYSKALVANKLDASTATAKQQISQLIALAKKWDVQHFVAVRDYSSYPTDLMAFQVNSLN